MSDIMGQLQLSHCNFASSRAVSEESTRGAGCRAGREAAGQGGRVGVAVTLHIIELLAQGRSPAWPMRAPDDGGHRPRSVAFVATFRNERIVAMRLAGGPIVPGSSDRSFGSGAVAALEGFQDRRWAYGEGVWTMRGPSVLERGCRRAVRARVDRSVYAARELVRKISENKEPGYRLRPW